MKNSIIFWNTLYILLLIGLGFYSIEALGIYLCLKSVSFFANVVDDTIDGVLKVFPAYHLNFMSLILFGGIGVFRVFAFIYNKIIKPLYDRSIGKFNKLLNGE